MVRWDKGAYGRLWIQNSSTSLYCSSRCKVQRFPRAPAQPAWYRLHKPLSYAEQQRWCPPGYAFTCKEKKFLCNVVFYEHEQMGKNLLVKWNQLRLWPGWRRLVYFNVKILPLNVAFIMNIANGEPFAYHHTKKQVIDAPVFLTVQGDLRDGHGISLNCSVQSSFKSWG